MKLHDALEKFRGHSTPQVNVIGRTRYWFALSGFFVVLSLVGLIVRGLNFSIDFEGGSLLKYPCPQCVSGAVTADDVRGSLSKFGLGDSEVQVVNGNSISVRTRSLTGLATRPQTILTLQGAAISVQDLQIVLAENGRTQADVSSTPSAIRVRTSPLARQQSGVVVSFDDSTKNLTADEIRTTLTSLGYPGAIVDVIGTTAVIRFASLPTHPTAPSPSPSPNPSPSSTARSNSNKASPSATAAPTPTASPTTSQQGRTAVIAELAKQAGLTSADLAVVNLSTVTEDTILSAIATKAGVSVDQITVKEVTGKEQQNLLGSLATQAGTTPVQVTRQDVGPTWGAQISSKALKGLIIFLILVSIYIAFRFEWKMAAAAQTALLHDLVITAGVYALVGRTVSPATVIAILTILGYSLYDTVVIFDKVRENTTETSAMLARDTYSGVVNTSLNQVLMRSVNTSLVVLLPILSLLLIGGATLKDFAFALFVGVASGTYSSVFVASPVLSILKEREPKLRQLRARLQQRGARPTLQTVPAGGGDGGTGRAAAASATPKAPSRPAAADAEAAPRPKKRRKTTAAQRRRR